MSDAETPATPKAEPSDVTKEQKMLAERFRIIEELLQTEYIYVNDLKTLVRAFYEPLQKDSEILPRDEFNLIFSNVKSILDFNETLYKDIRKALGTNPSESNKLAETFMILVQFLKMYSIYCQNRPNSLAAQERCRKKYPKFDKFVEEVQGQQQGGQTLDSFLVKPVQRICRYPLLFSGILKNTPTEHPDFVHIEKTLEKLQQVANDVNEFSKKKDNDDKLFELSLRMEEFPDESIISPGRLVVLERAEMDTIVPASGDKREPYYVCLFSDMLLFAKPKKKKLVFKHKIPLSQISWKDLEKPEEEEKWPLEITDTPAEGSPSVFITYDITKIERENFMRKLTEYSATERAKVAPTSPAKSALLRVAPKKKTRSISVSTPKEEGTDSAASADKKNRRMSAGKLTVSEDIDVGRTASPPKRTGSASSLSSVQEDAPAEAAASPPSSSRKELSPMKARFGSGNAESTTDKRARMKRASSQGNFGVREKISSSKGALDLPTIPKLKSKSSETKDSPSSSSKEHKETKDSSDATTPKDTAPSSSRDKESARGSTTDRERDRDRETKDSPSSSSSHKRSTSSSKDSLEESESSKSEKKSSSKHSSHSKTRSGDSDGDSEVRKLKSENKELKSQLDEANKKNAALLEHLAEIEKQFAKMRELLQPAKKG